MLLVRLFHHHRLERVGQHVGERVVPSGDVLGGHVSAAARGSDGVRRVVALFTGWRESHAQCVRGHDRVRVVSKTTEIIR